MTTPATVDDFRFDTYYRDTTFPPTQFTVEFDENVVVAHAEIDFRTDLEGPSILRISDTTKTITGAAVCDISISGSSKTWLVTIAPLTSLLKLDLPAGDYYCALKLFMTGSAAFGSYEDIFLTTILTVEGVATYGDN